MLRSVQIVGSKPLAKHCAEALEEGILIDIKLTSSTISSESGELLITNKHIPPLHTKEYMW